MSLDKKLREVVVKNDPELNYRVYCELESVVMPVNKGQDYIEKAFKIGDKYGMSSEEIAWRLYNLFSVPYEKIIKYL